jgi:hypothetical protein
MKQDITQLRELLRQASEICSNNLETENIDLHSMMEILDEYADELNAIGNFEVYGE